MTLTDKEETSAAVIIKKPVAGHGPGLKKIPPYWYAYTTMAKERWLGREILEMVSTEFRDRSMEYYRFALESGVTTINGKVAKPDTVIRNGDRIENVVHRHEPPVTSTPVKVLSHDIERELIIVDKPGSIPVHPSGRYFKNSLIEILESDFGYEKVYPVNRLDRLTSGLMVLPLSSERARQVSAEFMAGTVQKEYVARCKGKFPIEEVVCEEPLLTVDRQMGLNIVHPEGKPAKTIFNLIRYDEHTDSSVIRCQPITGRSHQIRVHLQYLGYPIANDPVYSEKKIWGDNLGKGGIDIVPSEERSAPAPPPHMAHIIEEGKSPENLSKDGVTPEHCPSARFAINGSTGPDLSSGQQEKEQTHREGSKAAVNSISLIIPAEAEQKESLSKKLFPRETGHDIGMGSPVPLSLEAVKVITKLRNMKDEDEDWSRWRDVVFRAKKTLTPGGIKHRPLAPPHRRERGGPSERKGKKADKEAVNVGTEVADLVSAAGTAEDVLSVPTAEVVDSSASSADISFSQPSDTAASDGPPLPQLTDTEAEAKLSSMEAPSLETSSSGPSSVSGSSDPSSSLYCPDCYLPLHPDPSPEKLYIFLHARKYTMSLGCFETEMPEWAEEDFVWDQDLT